MSLDAPPEVHPPHGHKGKGHGLGRPPAWLEWFTSIAALIVSVSSIFIALRHGETMDRLVKANSYPYLVAAVSDATPEGVKRFSLDLLNNGVGPADERSLTIRVGDRYVTSIDDLIRTSLAPQDASAAVETLRAYRNTAHSRFIASHSSQFVFRIDRTPQNAAWWDKLHATEESWKVDYCYCSVFEECWAVNGAARHRVKECVRDPRLEFTPKPREAASPLPTS
jgi:hypothetical protein